MKNAGNICVVFAVVVACVVAADAAPTPKPVPFAATVKASLDGPLLKQFLAGPMNDVSEIVFAVRIPGRDHWYVTFGNYASDLPECRDRAYKFEDGVYWGYGDGGRLCRFNLRTGQLQTILDDPKGGIRDPQVSYDGKTILFSYRPGAERSFHLYEIGIDGKNLKQLTSGPDDDIEPTYCPDGSIVFCSSRCRRFVNCWHSRVATLYRCDADGQNVRLLSSNNDHDNTPWMLEDGRILYMRWEYVDRSQLDYHHLWTANPDGTGQTVFYGNLNPGQVMLDAKPIPGTGKIVASFSPGHGSAEHRGAVTIVTPSRGPDDPGAARRISKQTDWKDPWAFSEDCFLVAHRKGIAVMNGAGDNELIYRLPDAEIEKFECHEPRPLMGRPREPIIASRVQQGETTGRLVLENFYDGRKTRELTPGTVKKLLVLKQLPKPVNFSGGMEPLTVGGSFTLAEILGTVPVEKDGSAFMELPALQSLFFVGLDENDRSVKRMHSFVTVQPGETVGCVGCHEPRTQAPRPVRTDLMAMRRAPSQLEKIAGVPSVIDYPRDIQPILDRHCVKCHNPDHYDGHVDLTGDRTAMYSVSYLTMQTRDLVADGRNRVKSNYDLYTFGSAASRIMKLIDGSHYEAKVSDHERTLIRLWLDTSATYPGTYASLGCGTYVANLPWGDIHARCGECHWQKAVDRRGKQYSRFEFGEMPPHRLETAYDLSRPEKSLMLRAPLAKSGGGLELCARVVFADKNDQVYQKTLAAIEAASRDLAARKRFDMPGFRPNRHYIREMQRFGFLPKTLGPNDPIDVYAVDRAYWDSFVPK